MTPTKIISRNRGKLSLRLSIKSLHLKEKKATFHANNGGPLSDGEAADQFNNFFVNVGPNLANKIPNTSVDPLSYIRSVNEESILLNHVTSDEVSDIIKGLRNSSPGWDEISAKIVKKKLLTFSHSIDLCM